MRDEDAHEGDGLFLRHARGLHEEGGRLLDEFVFALVGELAAVIAPLAVGRVLRTVGLGAVGHVGDSEGGAAALAQLAHVDVEELDDRHVQHGRNELSHVHGRLGLAVFPSRYRLPRDVELFSQILLGHPALLSRRDEGFLERHE